MINVPRTDLEYLKHAYTYAMLSPDPSTQNGAILVKDGDIVAAGINTFPIGVKQYPSRLERPIKYSYVEHAERNALYDAAACGVMTAGLTMYCPWFACTDCCRAIIQCGIIRVVGHKLPAHEDNPRWKESIAVALEMFDEAGVEYGYVEGKIGGVEILMNGVLVQP